MKNHERNNKDLERAIMFNDAVFAIALTLLVLELKFPEGAKMSTVAEMKQSLHAMLPKFLAFFLSAVLVGGNWISVTNLQRIIVRIDFFFVVDLVVYLIIISLIPFCCYLVGNYPENPMSFVVFGSVCELLVLNAYFFMRHCRIKNLYHQDADIKEIKRLEISLLIISVFLAGMMVVAFYSTRISFILFLLYNLIPFFVTHRLKITDSASGE